MANAENNTNNLSTYSKLIGWEIFNFMSIEHAEITFDEQNIINLKGYNDSGKSATLLALKVLMLNVNPTKQKDFIQDGKDFFKIIARFEDGVSIIREKYTNGQSLYEMYKGETCIYTTATPDGIMTKITEVPEPISNYLGLLMYEDTCLNARSCIESLIGVSTKGADNYKLLNTVLKSEELAVATTQLNSDKNEKKSELTTIQSEYNVTQDIVRSFGTLTRGLIDHLKEQDTLLQNNTDRYNAMCNIYNTYQSLISLQIAPDLPSIDTSRLDALCRISNIYTELQNIKITPHIESINLDRLQKLITIKNLIDTINSIHITPEIKTINTDKLNSLRNIIALVKQLENLQAEYEKLEVRSKDLDIEVQKQLEQLGPNTTIVKCPSCGSVFDSADASIFHHQQH